MVFSDNVKVGIKDLTRLPGGGLAIEYEPGNMTRYSVLVSPPVTGPAARVLCISEGSRVFTVVNLRKAMAVAGIGVHWMYVAEKLGVCEGDARPLAALFSDVMDDRGSFRPEVVQ